MPTGITVNLYNFYERLTIPSPTGGGGCLTVEHSQFVIDGISCRCAQVMRRLLFGRGQVPQDPVDGGHLQRIMVVDFYFSHWESLAVERVAGRVGNQGGCSK